LKYPTPMSLEKPSHGRKEYKTIEKNDEGRSPE